jgi:uracil-DNA glycosylase family 4
MLVGEAPGRFGAERTGIPFHGDVSGLRLERLIEAAGWTRAELFITNAVLCNPRDARGNNRPPAPSEVRACNTWLAHQIEVVNPLLVVALGAVALRALALVAPHPCVVRDAGESPIAWHDRWLAVAMHPGARAAIHRADALQFADFRRLGEWFRWLSAGSGACP